jgi:succinate dehydrogenase / fumarate reductase flavoprotein subunit
MFGDIMQAWDVVVVGSGVAALRAAIASSDEGATVTVLSGSTPSSFADDTAVGGLSASLGEATTSEHVADIHRIGADLCEAEVVTSVTGSAIKHLAELEKWGLNLRRDRNGSPHLAKLPGQSNARTASTGDSTLRETRTILQEQCMKRNIPIRGDIEIMDIVIHNGSANGLIALDIQTGEIIGIQSKSIVLAGSGFQSAWNGDGSAMGGAASLALRSGIPLANLEFTSMHPLSVSDTNLQLPLDLLGSGGIVNGNDGQPLAIDDGPDALSQAIISAGGGSLDLSGLSPNDEPWFAGIATNLQSRCGIDISQESIPLMPRAGPSIGGVPINAAGSVVNGSWNSSIRGLFAAGDAACSGLHGAAMNSGDHLLGSITSGMTAGQSAATHARTSKHSSSSQISVVLSAAHHDYDAHLSNAGSDGVSYGAIRSKLSITMQKHMGSTRDAAGLAMAAADIQTLQNLDLSVRDSSPVMNTEIVSMMQTKGLLAVAAAAVSAALAREESRGTHIRSDHPEADPDQANHSLSSIDGTVTTLPLRG